MHPASSLHTCWRWLASADRRRAATFLFTLGFVLLAPRAAAAEAPQQYPGHPDADIWILGGQSNMQGVGIIGTLEPPVANVMVYDLGGEWIPAVAPTHRLFNSRAPIFKQLLFKSDNSLTEENWPQRVEQNRLKPWGGIGPDLSFAQSVAQATGRHVGLVPCAFGGTTMAQWDPAGRDQGAASLYGNMLERIRAVGGNLKGLLWYQGESDAMSDATAADYERAFLNFVDSLRRDTGRPDLPVIFVQIARYCLENRAQDASWGKVQDTQRRLPGQRANLWVVPAVDLPLDDLIHISASGQARLGRRMAELALTHVYQLPRHGHAIDYASHEVLPAKDFLHHCLRVKFSGVTGRLQANGRPTGFYLTSDDPKLDGPMVYKVEFDPLDPAAVLVWYSKEIKAPVKLSYATGLDRYANINDSLDMAVPAFGPVVIEPLPAK
jgi:sialate O-acetylesterase